jgi:hypothetical protein
MPPYGAIFQFTEATPEEDWETEWISTAVGRTASSACCCQTANLLNLLVYSLKSIAECTPKCKKSNMFHERGRI